MMSEPQPAPLEDDLLVSGARVTRQHLIVLCCAHSVVSLVEEVARNLEGLGFPVEVNFDTVLLRGEREEWSQSEKASRRAHVASTHRIVMLIGDDLGDFLPGIRVSKAERDRIVQPYESWWGRRWFVLPNPMYGSWEGALTSGAPPEERRQRLLDALRTEQ